MNRQNPDYSFTQTYRDAMALITVAPREADDPQLVDDTLRQAMEGTNHTLLVFVLAQATSTLLDLMSQHTAQTREELQQQLAVALAATLLDVSDEDPDADA